MTPKIVRTVYQATRNASLSGVILSASEESGTTTRRLAQEAELLRAAALNLGFGAVPQAIPLWLAVGQRGIANIDTTTSFMLHLTMTNT
ncbi:MAG TPA: hypothetical protein VED37_00750 [Ktedonobacteraceae bacterium]|nr:hypothetical protein [Ktedonobacteraceae bacterium]